MSARAVTSDLLSADPRIAVRDRQRRALGLTHQALALGASIDLRGWYALRRGDYKPKRVTLAKIDAFLKRARQQTVCPAARAQIIDATFGGFFSAACRELGLDPQAARKALAGVASSVPFQAASDAREIALYLTNTALDVRQRTLARAAGLSPPAVLYAIRRVEDRRDEEAFDALVRRIEQAVTGGE